MMRRTLLTAGLLACAACGSSTGPPKPDPFMVIRVQDGLDPSSVLGQSEWHVYVLLTGPYPNQNGVLSVDVFHPEANRSKVGCASIEADSAGQRLVQLVAFADTVNKTLSDVNARAIAEAWFGGNHTVPLGIAVILQPLPMDPFDSQQYQQGHGLTRQDPVRWSWDWAADGTATMNEAPSGLPQCPTF